MERGMDVNSDRQQQRAMEKSYEAISPFEFKNKLIELANDGQEKSAHALLNAGRGNPNWIAATPRDAFFQLGQFALMESRRVWKEGHLAGKPKKAGIAERMHQFMADRPDDLGISFLRQVVAYGTTKHGWKEEDWVFELVDGIVGDNYPVPDRMLHFVETVVHDYLMKAMCRGNASCGSFHLFAVEGATAAMCYIFDTLLKNHLLHRGDKVAIMVPIFPPYVEIPHLREYDFEVVEIVASGRASDGQHTWQYPDEELDKLADPAVKALFLVNPSNPPSVALAKSSMDRLVRIVRESNPGLIVVSDDVYGTFVDDYESLLVYLPENTIGVYSFSKYFGVTGWRLGVVAVHQNSRLDEALRNLPRDTVQELNQRYASLTQHPEEMLFIDRLVADSRQVALNHTAGLSTPQQVQMALFAIFDLVDDGGYRQQTKDICRRRMRLLYDGLGLPVPTLDHAASYYTEFDLADWARSKHGEDFTRFLQEHYEPVDILFRLAEKSSIVLLNGGGFHGPAWSIRVSLANLDDEAYTQIGHYLHETLLEYVSEWQEQKDRK